MPEVAWYLDSHISNSILNFFAIPPSDVPTLRLFQEGKNMAKFKFEDEITVENLTRFLKSYHAGKLKVAHHPCFYTTV